MNRIILALSVIIILVDNLCGQWEILNECIPGSFDGIDFVNENTGWIIAGSGNTLLKTEDGGETWKFINLEVELSMIDFINESTGWGVGSYWDEVTDIGYIFLIKSVDGGQTWIIQKEFTGDYKLCSIFVVNDSVAYVQGRQRRTKVGKIYKTSDGGTNWIDISPNIVYHSFESIWFLNNNTGLVTGFYDDDHPTDFFLLRTDNGGESWEENIISESNGINNLQFINDSTAYFIFGDLGLCISTDTLNTWSILYPLSLLIPIWSIPSRKLRAC